MRKILFNAKVYVERGNFAEAVLIEDDKIIAAGSNEDIKAEASKSDETCGLAELIDCEGRTLIPGLNDSHLHFMQFGETQNQAMIEGVTSIDEMVEICREFASTHPNHVKEGLHAIGWNQDNFTDGDRIPDRSISTKSARNIL